MTTVVNMLYMLLGSSSFSAVLGQTDFSSEISANLLMISILFICKGLASAYFGFVPHVNFVHVARLIILFLLF